MRVGCCTYPSSRVRTARSSGNASDFMPRGSPWIGGMSVLLGGHHQDRREGGVLDETAGPRALQLGGEDVVVGKELRAEIGPLHGRPIALDEQAMETSAPAHDRVTVRP